MEPSPRNRFGFFLRKYNFFLLLIFFWGFVYLLLLGNNSLLSRLNLQSKMARTVQDIDRLTAENQALKNQISKIKSDRDHMEFLARKLGFIRKNEVVYKFEGPLPADRKPPARKVSAVETFVRKNFRFIIMGLALLGLAAVWAGVRLKDRIKRKGFDSVRK
jgi:cell division protein FtsB